MAPSSGVFGMNQVTENDLVISWQLRKYHNSKYNRGHNDLAGFRVESKGSTKKTPGHQSPAVGIEDHPRP